MKVSRFIKRSLWYFRRQHLAVFVGTLISTAVLTGALIIGDSVKYSLKQLVDTRLGNAKFALPTGDRFVRAELADNINQKLNVKTSALLIAKGIAVNQETENRINSVNVNGVENSFWKLSNVDIAQLHEDEAIISNNIAQNLDLKIGDEFLLRLENADIIPLNAPFVAEEVQSVALRLKVIEIANDKQMGMFSLKSNQSTPYNIFVSRDFLADKLELSSLANLILCSNNANKTLGVLELNDCFRNIWKLADAGVEIHEVEEYGKYELLSSRIFIDKQISNSILINKAYKAETILSYLVNTIKFNNKETPYSFVTAASAPMIPDDVQDDEIIINQWLANDLGVSKGDSISLDYYIIGPLRRLKEESKTFIVKKIIPTQGNISDSSLMPSFPGLSEAGSCSDWNTGIPIDLDKIRDKDEKYWDDFRGAPKALISIQSGHKLWDNKFGNYTSIRFNKGDKGIETLRKEILSKLNPEDLNLSFVPVYNNGLKDASNSVDFAELFLSLSFFVIFAGILLTVLIYTLNTESRKEESGILSGLGFDRKQILRIRFAESLIVAVLGGITGAFAGLLYNEVLLAGLNSVWKDAVRTNILEVYINPLTLITGAVGGFLIAASAIYIVTRRKLRQEVAHIIKNNFSYSNSKQKRNLFISKLITITGISGCLILILYSLLSSIENSTSLFLSAGALVMVACGGMVSLFFIRLDKKTKNTHTSIRWLAMKNVARNRFRSIATIILLATGVFTIVITGSNRKTFYGAENNPGSGTGGFLFWAETTMPVLYDLNTSDGRNMLGFYDIEELMDVDFVQFHSLEGDDASCLNLNLVQNPRILSLNPESLNDRHAFSFAGLAENIDKKNPWLELNEYYGDNVIPAYADQTVITWGLMKSIGDTLTYLNEYGKEIHLLIIGGLNSSIFQGNILISDNMFMKHFPSVSGSKIMLIDGPADKQSQISDFIKNNLIDYGIEVQKATTRLAEFNSVTNTYLSVFMMLGGLGVIIGTIGMGIIILRTLLDRKHEFALLMAIGYRRT
ncbi:ABC transporter permease, partial [Bacteroidota bacterium]